jgi:hypothetical protein
MQASKQANNQGTNQPTDMAYASMEKRTVLLHSLQELDNDLGGRTKDHLTLSTLLSVIDCFKSIG